MEKVPRCMWCKEVIGMYEPMIVHAEGEVRETSVLRERPHGPSGELYHGGCFREAFGQETDL